MTTEPALQVQQATSAGGVVYRRGEHGIEVLLCGRVHEGLWALPKGTPEPGESIEQTALREVEEETGLGVRIEGDLGTVRYEFARPAQGLRFDKTVYYFLMAPTGDGSVDAHDQEYDRIEWFAAPEALRMMTYENDASTVQRAIDAIDAMGTGERGISS